MFWYFDRFRRVPEKERDVRRGSILAAVLLLAGAAGGGPAAACVGKTLVVGAEATAQGRLVAQVIAILINERTGTTVKIQEFPDAEAVHTALVEGNVDIGVERAAMALERLDVPVPPDPEGRYRAAKEAYLERLNLVWLPPLGFDPDGEGPAAPVARKETLRKFPALPRLIAKTRGLLTDEVLAGLVSQGDPPRAARAFLRRHKLI